MKLFTYKRKIVGPRIEPWGPPDLTGRSREVALQYGDTLAPITNEHVKPIKQLPSEASVPQFVNEQVMPNLGKALDISKYTQST